MVRFPKGESFSLLEVLMRIEISETLRRRCREGYNSKYKKFKLPTDTIEKSKLNNSTSSSLVLRWKIINLYD